jgi:hypothetical protein
VHYVIGTSYGRFAPDNETISNTGVRVLYRKIEVSTLVTKKNAIFCHVTPCGVFLRSLLRFLVTANIVPRSAILVALMMEAIHSCETSVLTRATRRNIPDGGILHSRCL